MFWFLPVIGWIAASFGTGLLIGAISEWLNEDTIADTVHKQERFKNAFKAYVKDKSTRKVKLDIWDTSEQIGEMEIESSKGVSNTIYVGQIIELTN